MYETPFLPVSTFLEPSGKRIINRLGRLSDTTVPKIPTPRARARQANVAWEQLRPLRKKETRANENLNHERRTPSLRCALQYSMSTRYQTPQRDAGNVSDSYDLTKMKEAVAVEGGPFSLFGGEPLLLPLEDLEELWSWGLAQYGRNAVQTNGTLIGSEHIGLFRKYKVQVGISLDGPGELNDVRWHGDLEKTRQSTAKSEKAVERESYKDGPSERVVCKSRAGRTRL